MSEPQVARFTKSMMEQGVGVLRTKKGLLLRLPDGSSTSVHFTNSDIRATTNLYARLRRAGVRHPEDPKNVSQLPSQITEGTTAPRTKLKVLEAMKELNYPDSVTVQQMRSLTGLEHITASKALFHLGFTPVVGRRNSRDWMTPADLLDQRRLEPESEPAEESPTFSGDDENGELFDNVRSIVDGARAFQQEVNDLGMGEPQVQAVGDREFIDTHDSWIVDLKSVPKEVRTYMKGLAAAGLHAEIRVWRA